MEVPINYWLLLAAAVISVALGFIWYGPLFGKQWAALSGIAMPEQKPPLSTMIRPIIISAIGAIIATFVLMHAMVFGNAYLGTSGVATGLTASFWNWLGFIVPPMLNFVGWEGKSWKLFFINTGYWLVFLAIMGMLFAFWA